VRRKPLKIYGGVFDGVWLLQVAATSWKEAIRLFGGHMSIKYACQHGNQWIPGDDDKRLTDEPGVVWRSRATVWPKFGEKREWERIP
jgi:hypothetical protein